MADTPSSTSEKPLFQKVGLGFLLDDSDPIAPATKIVEIHHSENAPAEEADHPTPLMLEVVSDEELEFRNAIERDLRELTIQQAEIESAYERLEIGDEEKGDDHLGTVEKGDHGSESVDDEIDIDGGDEDKEPNVASSLGDDAAKFGRFNQNSNRKRINYPMRPDAEDCAYYMKFGSCKFGLNCKFNHPPKRKNQGVKERTNHREENSERAGQSECKYYLTSAGCKYGKDCKYTHGSERSSTTHMAEFNFLGLPIRIGEKECPFYVRTASCKYGSNCRFHHPEPVTVGSDSPSGYRNGGSIPLQFVSSSSGPSWSSPRAFNETSPSPYLSLMFPPSQGAPTSNQDWNGYQAPTFAASEGLPTPPAFAMNNLPADLNFHMRHQPDVVLEEYPERPANARLRDDHSIEIQSVWTELAIYQRQHLKRCSSLECHRQLLSIHNLTTKTRKGQTRGGKSGRQKKDFDAKTIPVEMKNTLMEIWPNLEGKGFGETLDVKFWKKNYEQHGSFTDLTRDELLATAIRLHQTVTGWGNINPNDLVSIKDFCDNLPFKCRLILVQANKLKVKKFSELSDHVYVLCFAQHEI